MAYRYTDGSQTPSRAALLLSYLQVVQGQSITAAGHVTLTSSFTSTVALICIGIVIKYTRHYKYFITAGACIYLMGIGLMIRYRKEGSSISQVVGTQIAVGIGGGMLNVPAQLAVQASASYQEVAAATAIHLTIVEIGGAVGSAISGAGWTANIPKKLALYMLANAKRDAVKIFEGLPDATSYAMGSPGRIAINRAYQETMNILLIISICVAAPLILLSLLMENDRLDQVGPGTPHSLVADTDNLQHRLTNMSKVRSSVEVSVTSLFSNSLKCARVMPRGYLAPRDHGTCSSDEVSDMSGKNLGEIFMSRIYLRHLYIL